jgi:hypothetical protein
VLRTPTQLGPMAGQLGKETAMAHSPHRRRKGCGLCRPWKHKDTGRAVREPWPVLRKLGKRRRLSRGDLGDQ